MSNQKTFEKAAIIFFDFFLKTAMREILNEKRFTNELLKVNAKFDGLPITAAYKSFLPLAYDNNWHEEILNEYKVNYLDKINKGEFSFFNHHLAKENADINLIIPCSNRYRVAKTTIQKIQQAAKRCNLNLNILAIEQSSGPDFLDVAKSLNILYIHQKKDLHSQASIQNIAYYILPKAKWYCFHCADALPLENWLEKVEEKLQKPETSFVQGFQDRALLHLVKDTTKKIHKNPVEFNCMSHYRNGQDFTRRTNFELEPEVDSIVFVEGKELTIEECVDVSSNYKTPEDFKIGNPAGVGAPGGSIFVRQEDFENVGGFEEEYFYDGGPEDKMLWQKLDFIYQKKELNSQHLHSQCFFPNIRGDVGMDLGNSNHIDLPMFHLWHAEHGAERTDENFGIRKFYSDSYFYMPTGKKKSYNSICSKRLLLNRHFFQSKISQIKK